MADTQHRLGGALFVSIGQNVFSNKLLQGLAKYAPSIDPSIILKIGATSIQSTVGKSVLPGVTLAYNDALTHSFLVAAVMAAVGLVPALAMEWKSVKKDQKKGDGGAADVESGSGGGEKE